MSILHPARRRASRIGAWPRWSGAAGLALVLILVVAALASIGRQEDPSARQAPAAQRIIEDWHGNSASFRPAEQ